MQLFLHLTFVVLNFCGSAVTKETLCAQLKMYRAAFVRIRFQMVKEIQVSVSDFSSDVVKFSGLVLQFPECIKEALGTV